MTGAVASVVLASSAYAAGLGKLTVLSSLGQPLRAEIELTAVAPEEAQGLAVRLASVEAFRLANIEFNPSLMSLRFEIEDRNGRQVIRVSSTQPLNEPFVDMLLELSWNSGRLVREYTFLLDPAELRSTQSAQVAPQVVRQPAEQRPAAAPVQQRPAAQPAAPQPAAAKGADSEYRVRAGDTLGKIARQLKPADVSLDVMLVALYRANPDSFIGNNMNRLRSGTILTVPDSESLRGAGEGEARGTVIAHAADFNAYRNKLAGQVASADPSRSPEASQSAAGRITARVEERPTGVNEAKDQLRLSRAAPAATAAGEPAGTTVEDKIAKERELADAAARVKELEKNVSQLEELLAVKGEVPAAAAAAGAGGLSQTPPPAAKPVEAAKPAPAATLKKRTVTEPSLVDTIVDNLAYIGGGLLVLLLGGYAVAARRKKTVETATPSVLEPSTLGAPSAQAHSLFAETGGQSVDTSNSVFNSSFAPSASQLDTNEVDPVAEADVYIAYGRDAQAEEILKEALRTHPERMPVRLKLLEIYASRKDQRAFETQASEIYSLAKGTGDDWAQAAALGLAIDPLNPLYAGAPGAPLAAPSAPEREQQAILSQEMDGALAAEPPAMDLDLSSDMNPAPAPAAAPAPVAAAADEHTLDFDLGGLSFEPGKTEERTAQAAPAPAAAVEDMSFDLDATAVPAAEAPQAPAAAEPAAADLSDMAFDLSFDSPSQPAAETPAAAEPAEAKVDDLSLDFMPASASPAPASAMDDFAMADLAAELDLPELPGSEPAPATDAAMQDAMRDLEAMSFDLPSIPAEKPVAAADTDFDSEMFALELQADATAEAPAASPAQAPSFDLSGLDLDLPASAAAADLTAVPEPIESAAENMEMETKLDLAIAYQEIGDKEGARELIDEVIKGGTATQVAKASALREQLV
ncbi:MAG TPA: FimV/HubP family polar landmark protein [Telluria sp.]|nr:FimV/HubP family polar landmark protein [Telluria sp.]